MGEVMKKTMMAVTVVLFLLGASLLVFRAVVNAQTANKTEAPHFDSGWVKYRPEAGKKSFHLGLGGNMEKYLVKLEERTELKDIPYVHNIGIGKEYYYSYNDREVNVTNMSRSSRILRGAGFKMLPRWARTSARAFNTPTVATSQIGLRPVRRIVSP